jgi:hypothetical protein
LTCAREEEGRRASERFAAGRHAPHSARVSSHHTKSLPCPRPLARVPPPRWTLDSRLAWLALSLLSLRRPWWESLCPIESWDEAMTVEARAAETARVVKASMLGVVVSRTGEERAKREPGDRGSAGRSGGIEAFELLTWCFVGVGGESESGSGGVSRWVVSCRTGRELWARGSGVRRRSSTIVPSKLGPREKSNRKQCLHFEGSDAVHLASITSQRAGEDLRRTTGQYNDGLRSSLRENE